MIRPENRSQDLLLSITKNCETLIQQTHRKPKETFEFKMAKPRETVHFNTPVEVKEDWMIGLISLEVHSSIFKITEENNEFQLYIFPDEKVCGFSYGKVRDGIGRDLEITDIIATDLQDEIRGSIIIEEYREQVRKRIEDGG